MVRGSQQSIEIPVSLQLQNLQEIANSLKKFAGENILGDSINGKKINAELQTVLKTLIQIETRAKNGFKIDSDFGGLDKEINRVELSLDKVYSTIGKLTFDDLKVPSDVQEKINELNAQIKQLRDNFNGVKEAQKTALVNNGQFALDLNKAFPSNSSKILGKTYDEIGEAIKAGTTKIQARLEEQQRILQQKQLLLSENKTGQANFAAQNVLDFLEKGFKELPKNPNTKLSDQQQILEQYMKIVTDTEGNREFTGFKNGASYNNFFNYLSKQYELTPEQLDEIKQRIRDQMTTTKKTAAQVMREMATDRELGAKIMVNTSRNQMIDEAAKYADQVKDTSATEATIQRLTEQGHAANAAWQAFQGTVSIVSAANEQLKGALQGPQTELEKLQQSVLENATAMPQLSQAQQEAAASLDQLRSAASAGEARLKQMNETVSKMDGVSNFINRYIGLYAIVRKVSTAIRNAFNNIKELDKTITSIAVVTNMSQKDLWGKIGEYTQMAQQYGVAVKGVYEVSQIFYQQGLQTSQVMSLTTETLKMAKIAGIDYSTAANAMTVAVRAFKLEMSEAQQVTDTYSALAAKFAVSSAEIANAMEKTASSAASVGMSLESTSAFISVMEQTTRESAQNIGSALKSIISRYGEMKASPSALLNVDGEEVAFNKVDTALKSIGISIKDASGQFRDFDDVIMELAQKWNSLDNNTQRYIATIMAGNRQQSRFIALVSNYDELSRAMDTAANAENASIVQVAKTMDSLESKANQLQNAFSQLYLDLHIEDGLKGAYDWLTKILKTIGKLGVGKGLLPSLMNVIGLGTGTKKLIGMGKEAYQKRVKKIQVEVEDKNNKIQEIQNWIKQPEDKVIRLKMDDSQIQQISSTTGQALSTTQVAAFKTLQSIKPNVSLSQFRDSLIEAKKNNSLTTDAGREAFLSKFGITKENTNFNQYQQIDSFLGTIGSLNSQLQTFSSSLQNASNSADKVAESNDKQANSSDVVTDANDEQADSSENVTNTKQQEVESSQDLIANKQHEAQESQNAANADAQEAQESENAANADAHEAQESQNAASADAHEAQQSQNAATGFTPGVYKGYNSNANINSSPSEQIPQENPINKTHWWNKKGYSFKDNQWGEGNARAVAGAATSIARIAGTAIAAAGAAHEDKSTDAVEASKFWTGIGNGISMAGTGASIGMSFGPWGAAIGAIGGFLVGGLDAIIDGAEMTIQERIALKKEEVKKVEDESLKAQSKSIEIGSSIENIKKLQKSMYDSTEDMQAYKDAMNTLASEYPNLVSAYDESGNAIINLEQAEQYLIAVREQSALASRKAAVANAESNQLQLDRARELLNLLQQAYNNQTNSDSYSYQVGSTTTSARTTKTGWEILDEFGNKTIVTSRGTSNTTKKTSGEGVNWANTSTSTSTSSYDYEGAIKFTVAQAYNLGYVLDENIENYQRLNEIIQEYGSDSSKIWTRQDLLDWTTFLKDNYKFTSYQENPIVQFGSQQLKISGTQEYGNYWSIVDGLRSIGAFVNTLKNKQEMTFSGKVNVLDAFVKEYKEYLGTTAENAGEYFKWDNPLEPTYTELSVAMESMENIVQQLENSKKNFDIIADKASAQEYFYNSLAANESFSSSQKANFSGNNLYSSLVYQRLKRASEEKHFESLMDWSKKSPNEYRRYAIDASKEVISWLETLTSTQIENFEQIMTNLDSYQTAEDVITKLGITDNKIITDIQQQFIESNKANRDRILKTIYSVDENGEVTRDINTDFSNLANMVDENGKSFLDEIGLHFLTRDKKGSEDIITKYSDYFTTSIVDINKLAEEGYTELASNRLQILSAFADSLSSMNSSEQQDMFGILTKVDFSSYESIQTAKESLTNYTKEKGITIEGSKFKGLWNALEEAENKLIFNVTTLANTLTTQIESAAKEMDSILSTNKSGLSFDKALEEYKTLSAKFSDLGNFDTIFSYDAVLGKYVYTQEGLQKAIQAREQNLQDTAERLSKEASIYQDRIAKNLGTEENPDYRVNYMPWLVKWDNKESTLANFNQIKELIDKEDQDLIPYYENLINSFWDKTDIEHNSDTFKEFIIEIVQADGREAEAAQKILQEYQANKKNQYYQAIDWSKLALGTDISGTNKNLMESLAAETEKYGQNKIDETTGKIIGRELQKGIDATSLVWSDVLEAYLEETYSDKNMREIVRAAINGQISQQKSQSVSTAITELLNGAGSAISEETAALLYVNGQLEGKLDSNGLLESGLDYVQSALDLFETMKSELTTAAERNASYKAIMDKKFSENNAAISFLASGASLDTSTVESFFTSLGKNIDEFYDVSTNTWFNGLGNVLSTDMFGKTRITDWEGFKQKLNLSDAFTQTYEYLNAYSSYVDGVIQNNAQLRDLIKKSYDNAFNQIDLFKEINVSQMSQEGIEVLTANGAATINDGILVVNSAIDYANNAINYFTELSRLSPKELYEQTGWTSADLAKNWKTAQTALTQAWDSWSAIGNNLNAISTDQMSTLIEKGGLKIEDLTKVESAFTKVGDHYVLSLEKYADYLLKSSRNISPEQYQNKLAEARQTIINNITGLDWAKVLDGTATDVDLTTFTDSLRDNLASLSLDLNKYIHDGNLNITELTDALQGVDQALVNHIKETIAEIQNNILSSISSAATYNIEGTNDITNMQKFVDEYNKLTNKNISISGAFEYDTILDQFILSSNVLNEYINAQKEQLKNLGMSGKAIDEYIKDQTQIILQQNMNFVDFITTNSKKEKDQIGAELAGQIEKMWTLQGKAINYRLIADILRTIDRGGQAAVEKLKEIKGEEVTSEEIDAVYHAAINRINEAQEALESGEGTILYGLAAEIAKISNGIETTELPDGGVVITAVTSMADAYSRLYAQMKNTSEKTTASLNSLYAKFLTSIDQPEIDAISTLNDAMGMTYEALGEMLANYGIQLEDVMKNADEWGLQSIGSGKVQIYDFKDFAAKMGWDFNSEEYLSAFKTYNDSLIELNGKTEKAILDEVKELSGAKIGDKINFTYLWNKISDNINALGTKSNYQYQGQFEAAYDKVFGNYKKALELYGATFVDGILTIGAEANIQGIITTIAQLASENAALLPEELAELADVISDYIDNIISLIKNGISGSLKNVDAQKLQSWADQFHLNLDFTQTAEGLKLSQKSAIELYNALKGVDNIKAKLVFDELNKSLQETNEHYQSISSIMQRIAEIEQIVPDARSEEYEKELALAKEILAVRSTSEDSSFSFMSNKIPGAQNNPINYFNNWASAIQKLQEAMKTTSTTSDGKTHKGLIDYQDWYNIATEMGNMAKVTGNKFELAGITIDGSLEKTAALIEKGASALTVDSTGNLKVALGDIGIDFEAGAGEMSSGIETGIQEMARSQVDMLDGLIALLELIVQMGQLGDIDIDGMGISFEEIFDPKSASGFSKAYEDWREAMLDQLKLKKGDKGYNEDLQNALKDTMINGQSLASILELTPSGLRELEKSTQDAYAAVLDAFSKAAKSGNFDTDNIYESIKSVLAESGLGAELSITVGDTTLVISGGQITSIDWKDADTKKVLEQWEKEGRGKREDLIKKIEQYHSGEAIDTEDLTYVLKLEKKLQIDDSGKVTVSINGKNQNLGKLDDNQFTHVQNWLALQDLGYEIPENVDIIKQTDAILPIKTDIKAQQQVMVSYDEKNGLLYTDEDGYVAKSIEELAENLLKRNYHYQQKYASKEEVMWGEFGIRAKVTPKVTATIDGKETEVSLKSGSEYRAKVEEDLQKLTQENLDTLGFDKTGNLEIELGGVKFTLSGNDVIDSTGKANLEKVKAQIQEQFLGMDLGLQDNIINALTSEQTTAAISSAVKEGIQQALNLTDEDTTIKLPEVSAQIVKLILQFTGTPDLSGITIPETLQIEGTYYAELVELILKMQQDKTPNAEDLKRLAEIAAQIAGINGSAEVESLTMGAPKETDNTALENAANTAAQGIDAGAGTGTVSSLTVELPINTKAQYKDNSIIISDITTATGEIGTLTATKIGDVTGTATNAEVTAEHYHITFQKEDPENPGTFITEEVDIPANVKFGDSDSLADWLSEQTGLKTPEITAILSSLQEAIDKQGILKAYVETEQYENPLLNLYNQRKDRWLTDKDFQIASRQDALDRNKFGMDQYANGEEYYNALVDEVFTDKNGIIISPLIESMKESIIEGYNQGLSEINLSSALDAYQNANDGQFKIDFDFATIQDLIDYLDKVPEDVQSEYNFDAKAAKEELETLIKESEELDSSDPNVSVTANVIDATTKLSEVLEKIANLRSKTITVTANVTENGSGEASGNVGLAKAQGTLMGELGPELYVQNGRYFVAGQNGPEFVDLAPDAIVFNHLQTRSLLDKGMSPGRGKAVTNERTAVSYAKGNINGGPAMASASAALAALKQLRAQWQALAQLNVKDLAGAGGGGGGGDKAFIKDLERWYNWLQRIAQLEKEITYEENLRNKIQSDMIKNGKAYYASQKRSLDALKEQVAVTTSLMLSQSEYFDKRRAELNSDKNPFQSLYWFDEYGQLKYKDGKFEEFTKMVGTDKYNSPNMTPKEQYEYITQVLGIDKNYMKYDNSGNEIKGNDYNAMVQAFWDKIDTDQKEMQSLHDSIEEQKNAITSELQKQNELIQAMKDNQKEVEEAVLGAIVESRERQIKELQDTKDALQKSNQDFIDGLSKQLDKEQKMYQNSQKDQELQRNRRQLAILQRSGASASQIAALQKQIEQQSQDEYFTKQQEQINAVKEASDLQIERLDHQIELEQKELEYQKANGLLWEQVYDVMSGSSEDIAAFITGNTESFWSQSPLTSMQNADDWIFKADQWTEYRNDIHGIYDALTAAWGMFDESMKDMFGSGWEGLDDETKKSLQNKFMQVYQETGDYNEAAKAIQQTDVYQELKKKQDEETALQYQETEKPESPKDEVKITSIGKWEYDAQNHWRTIKYSNGNSWVQKEPHKYKSPITNASKCTVCGRQVSQYSPQSSSTSSTSAGTGSGLTISGGVLTHITPTIDPHMLRYASGGLIDYTGPAWVDGTPQKPESIWDAETTKLMRDNLLNPRNLNLLGTFWDTLQGYQSATNHSYSSNSESLVIENATVNMNVASIANDYDARRAGEQAMEEMLKIARKTKVSSF